jgi:anti-sigma B factor antagonist
MKDELPALNISFEAHATRTIVRVAGELDFSTSDRLDAAIAQTPDTVGLPVIVDFTECRYIDSTVLTVLVRASKTFGDRLRLVIPAHSHVRRIFKITNLDRMISIGERLDD